MNADETALVVLVPEAEFLVKPFRDRFDPSAALGVPAHITLLYPFKPPDEIDEVLLAQLRDGFARFAPIAFALQSIRRFPGVLYLAPDPAEPFRALIRRDHRLVSRDAALWRQMARHHSSLVGRKRRR